ncbi:MAG: hypothetical protein QM528_06760, partial [Phycisphaerales bacterium]|nr:hypothetical protein [Phycisphaerales bacterium]
IFDSHFVRLVLQHPSSEGKGYTLNGNQYESELNYPLFSSKTRFIQGRHINDRKINKLRAGVQLNYFV